MEGAAGFVISIAYVIIIFSIIDKLLFTLKYNKALVNTEIVFYAGFGLIFLAPVLVWYFIKRKGYSAFFWGFITPYLLVLLLSGMCGLRF